MTGNEIRKRFLNFFQKRGHSIIPSASLVTSDEKGVTNSTLFNTAGMQPLIPYLLGKEHPHGVRLVDSQKCVRTIDIEEVGDNTHLTFFEMLGNWSLGDYFKEEAISWSYEFLTSKEEGLGLDPKRLYITVFEGNEDAPRDDEAFNVWKKYMPENHIYFMGVKSNWWSAGDNGPCGPDTEMFYDTTEEGLGDLTQEEFNEADERQQVVEIWNDVFMEYEKKDGKVVGKLPNKNVDTGSGLERLTYVIQNKKNVFETDLFETIILQAKKLSDKPRDQKIIADHIKTSIFMISDGVVPSNTDRGYILRRLIRRATFLSKNRYFSKEDIDGLVNSVVMIYSEAYPELITKRFEIQDILLQESDSFKKAISGGLKEFERISTKNISGEDAFRLFSSYGFPVELTKELAQQKGVNVDMEGFREEFKIHQDLSRKGAEQKFKGGLSSHGEMEVKYHTATHLLHTALKQVLGEHVFQKGSNITPDRLRFDFSHGEKMSDEEKERVENIINKKIQESLPVIQKDMDYDDAKKLGAIGLFGDKYDDIVSVYTIGSDEEVFSRELCGGPHVQNTNELGTFKIKKEEACSAGIRRIKAVLE